MYERPSETELFIRSRVNEFKAQSMEINMSGVYPSPPGSPPRSKEYIPSSPNYGAPKSPSYVPYQGKPAYSPISTSPIYVSPTPMSPAYVKVPSTEAKCTAEAQMFADMMREYESGTSKADVSTKSLPTKSLPTVSDSSKEDARWSLMKDEEGDPIRDLATGLDYYTDGLCDQEQAIQETEIALERRIKEMNATASTLPYVDFCKKYDDVERFQNKLRDQLRDYSGAAKLLEANLIIRNEIRDSKLVWRAEEAIAEAAKLKDGLLESANKADEFMDTAHDIADIKRLWDESENTASFEEVDDEMMVDALSDAGEDVELDESDDDDLPWTEDEFVAELERHIDTLAAAEEAEKMVTVDATATVESDAAFLGRVNAAERIAGKSPFECLSQAEKERYDDILRGLCGDDDSEDDSEHEEDSYPFAALSSLFKANIDYKTHGFAGLNAGLKPVSHAPTVSSPLAAQPVLVMEDEVTPLHNTSEICRFDFLGGDRPSGQMAFASGGLLTAAFLEADDDFEEPDEVPETPIIEPLTSNRKRSSFGGDDASMNSKKAKLSHDFAIPEVHLVDEAPGLVKVNLLSGDRPSDMVNFAAGGLLTAAFLEADDDFVQAEEVPEAPVLEPLTANRKRSRSDDDGASVKKFKSTHDFSAIPEVGLADEAPEPLKLDFSGGDSPSVLGNLTAGDVLTAESMEADDAETPVLESLTPKRKRSSSGDAFTPSKKAKFTHDYSVPEASLSTTALETQSNHDVPEVQDASPPAHRPIKALKGSRTGASPPAKNPFCAVSFKDAPKATSALEPLPSSRKRSCPSSESTGGAPVEHSATSTPSKKIKLSASTTELVQTLLFNIESYGVDGQLSLPSPAVVAKACKDISDSRKAGKHSSKLGVWRDAISKSSSSAGVQLSGVMSKIGGKTDGLCGLRVKYLTARGRGVGGLARRTVRV
ncbi:hypothetical protein BLS_001382 [Venturia inaequalis]|uniref:Uncharacterized protein n=1 Tax=Venturia inaequalis TaxID=5025 RepID=A0A8H3UZ96_VENIN|nr:hypothetical protein BLS_001382 [Venturia inaequalis]